MPLPKPRPTENKGSFMSRCMRNSTMKREFTTAQRQAVCLRQWEDD